MSFISLGTSRLLLPISKVILPDHPTVKEIDFSLSERVKSLQEAVRNSLEKDSKIMF